MAKKKSNGGKGKPKWDWQQVLVYHPKKRKQETVWTYYLLYRKDRGLPLRCDTPNCQFHTGKLEWNNRPLPLTLDHKNGLNKDNRPENLQLVCPNCAFQLPTHAGRNKGHVIATDANSFVLKGPKGTREIVFFPSDGVEVGGSADVRVIRKA